MRIKHFTMTGRRVPDPLRPGRTAVVGVLKASGGTGLTLGSKVYEPDAEGWIDVPHEDGVRLTKFRDNGSGFYTPGDVDDETRLGRLDPEEPAKAVRRGRPRREEAEASAED